jgi:hypothetical protein
VLAPLIVIDYRRVGLPLGAYEAPTHVGENGMSAAPAQTAVMEFVALVGATVATAVLEAVTTQIDNLILPVFAYGMLLTLRQAVMRVY